MNPPGRRASGLSCKSWGIDEYGKVRVDSIDPAVGPDRTSGLPIVDGSYIKLFL